MGGDLNALFDSVDGFKDDLMEYGIIAAGAIGANVAWTYAKGYIPASIPDWAVDAGAIALGVVSANYVSKVNRKLGLGVAVGLVAAGLSGLASKFIPSLPLAGVGDELLLGIGAADSDPFQKYLAGAPSTIEQVSGLNAAPKTIEELGDADESEMSGLAAATIF